MSPEALAASPESVGAPRVSALENLAFNATQILPGIVNGVFLRRPLWYGLWARLHPDPSGVRLIGRLARRHGGGIVRLSLLGRDAVLVLDTECIRQVLERSPRVYADPKIKRLGMTHFQPEALTISRGDAWRERRRFNEAVLAYADALHPRAAEFHALVRGEVEGLAAPPGERLAWPELAGLFERIALGVVFGAAARDARSITDRLARLMNESNRIFGLGSSRHFEPFYGEIRAHLHSPADDALLSLCPHARPRPATRAENQIPHWLFGLRDTLATNVIQALALIASHPKAEARVREELRAAPATPEGIAGMRYLGACLEEAMRLWPTTQMIMREALVDTALEGEPVAAGTVVIIHNGFNHRDPRTVPDPDRFVPDRFLRERHAGGIDYRFNHMSNGGQSCAGRNLALFVGKAVLAGILERGRCTLVRPRLDPARPLPHAIDCYRTRFRWERDAEA